MAMEVRLYRTYRFLDKDPVIDKVRTLMRDEGVDNTEAHVMSGVSTTTFDNWFKGGTRKPQHATIMATVTALGYDMQFVKQHSLDKQKELERGASWLLKRAGKKKKKNGHG